VRTAQHWSGPLQIEGNVFIGRRFKPDSGNFDFIKTLAQILNIFSKVQQKKKKTLIYAEMVKVLW